MKRRDFVRASAAGAALSLAVSLTGCRTPAPPEASEAAFAPDAWIRLFPDGTVLVEVDRSEMGQGVSTALPMLVAEEMDVEWSQVRYAFAPVHPAYVNPLLRAQITGGSTAIMAAWVPLREAGARARAMLVSAAAQQWGVPAEDCRTEPGVVVHPASGRRAVYGALAAAAAQLPVPERVALKEPRDFRLIGKAAPRLDTPAAVRGGLRFGLDAGPRDALVAVVARCPVAGGALRRVDDTAARAVPGVRHVVTIDRGVAVVADGYWPALKGRAALVLEWDEGPTASLDSAAIATRLAAALDEEGVEVRKDGTGVAALPGAARTIEARYDLPFLAHACMEPMNCTADVREDGVTIWVPTQSQAAPGLIGGGSRGAAAKAAGVSPDRVTVVTTNLGGGFGRRAETDYVMEAVQVAKAVGTPVRLTWTREDDIQHDFLRPVNTHRLRAGLTADGAPLVWSHHIAAPSITDRYVPSWVPRPVLHLAGPFKGGLDPSAVEGAREMPYTIPNLELRYTPVDFGIPVGFWRSVGHSHTAFAVECFIDELAHAAGRDPVAYRLKLLPRESRQRRVLQAVAERAGWGTPLPPGRGRGVAVHESFGSPTAQVAEVEVRDGTVRVRRVTCAFDCGIVVNPDIIRQQIEGGIVFGLGAALKGEITIRNGRVVQGNFHDYPLLTLAETPQVDVILVPSGDAPGGVGEPGTPPIAPAVVNAIFAATGKRIRRLPIAGQL